MSVKCKIWLGITSVWWVWVYIPAVLWRESEWAELRKSLPSTPYFCFYDNKTAPCSVQKVGSEMDCLVSRLRSCSTMKLQVSPGWSVRKRRGVHCKKQQMAPDAAVFWRSIFLNRASAVYKTPFKCSFKWLCLGNGKWKTINSLNGLLNWCTYSIFLTKICTAWLKSEFQFSWNVD